MTYDTEHSAYDLGFPQEATHYGDPANLPHVDFGVGFDEAEPGDGLTRYEDDISTEAIGNGYTEAPGEDYAEPTLVATTAVASGNMALAATTDMPHDVPDPTPDPEGDATAEDVEEPVAVPVGGGIVPPPPPGGGDVLAMPGDDAGRDPMDQPANSDALYDEFLGGAEVSPHTRNEFDETVHDLEQRTDPPSRIDRKDFVVARIGRDEGPRIEIGCAAEEHTYARGNRDSSHQVYVTVTTTPTPQDPWDVVENPPVARHFKDGHTTDYHLGDDGYNTAMAELERDIPSEVWGWVEAARTVAATVTDPVERQAAVETLLTGAPDVLLPCRSIEYRKQFLDDTGAVTNIRWLEANTNYVNTLPDTQAIREVRLRTPERVLYTYRAYPDGTEQLVVETGEEDKLAELRARGFAAMLPGEAGTITPEARRMGVQRPSEALMSHFNDLLRRYTGRSQ